MEPPRRRRRRNNRPDRPDQASRWVFTYFPEGGEFEGLLPFDEWQGVRYLVYQLEQAPDTGRLHFQGYIELIRSQRLSWVRRLEGLEGAHFEVAGGDAQANRDYCTKIESRIDGYWEHGQMAPGERRYILRRANAMIFGTFEDLRTRMEEQYLQ